MPFLSSNDQAPALRVSDPGTRKAADPTHFLPKVETGYFTGILIRRGWLVVVLGALGVAGGWWLAKGAAKIYRAHGSVYVSTQAPMVLDIRAVAPEESRDLEQMRSVEQGMLASTLLMRVMEKHGLAEDPEFAGSGPQTMLQQFATRVGVELRRGTRLIDLSVEDTDPERAKRLVEALVSEYELWTTERQQAVTRQASEGLAREEERLRGRMEASAARLQEFRENHPVPGLEDSAVSGNTVRDELGALSAALTQAKAERLRLEAEVQAFRRFDPEDPEALAGLEASGRGSEVQAQVRAIQQKEAEFAAIRERYLELHPVYKTIATELARLKQNLAATARSAGQALEQRYKVVAENEAKLEKEVELARNSAVDVEGVREQFWVLSREAEAERALHDAVALRLRETTLAASVPASVLRWEDVPMTPEHAHRPRKVVYLALGAMGGMFCGLVLMAGLELGDRTVRNPAAAARATGSPLLATIPEVDGTGDAMLLLSDPSSKASEAFRHLCAALAPVAGNSPANTVLFASAKTGEGRSFCALNYATALALQGHRTLLLDADMRRPGLSAAHLNGTEEAGLGGYLAGHLDAAGTCFTTALPNLYLLSSGPMRPDAAELLGGTRFPALLEDAYKWFDRVVIDTPPVLATSDMLAMARYADRCCLVVGGRRGDRHELRRAAELTRSAGGNLIGFVWNGPPAKRGGQSAGAPVVPVTRSALPPPPPPSEIESDPKALT